MTYGSVYEITNPLTKVAGQRMINNLGTGRHNDADMMGFFTTNVVGSGSTVGSGNGVDNGYLIRSSSGGGDWSTLSFNNKRFLSNTGSVVIWVGCKSGGNWGGFGMTNLCGAGSIDNDRLMLQAGDSGYVVLVTNDSSQANTDTDLPFSDLNTPYWSTMKLEQKLASGDGYFNGILKATNTTKLSRAPMQPMSYAYGASMTTYVRFCEAYNT